MLAPMVTRSLRNFCSTAKKQIPKSQSVMKPIISFAALCALAVVANGSTTDPVGYTTVPLPGTGGSVPNRLQIGNLGLLPSDAVQTTGTADSVTATYLEDAAGTWAAGDYVNGAAVSHLVEILDGPLAGTLSWITSTDDSGGAGQRLYTQDDLSAAGAAGYRVVKAFTVGGLLGDPPVASVMGGGTNSGAADNMLILDASTGVYDTIWYKNGGIGGTGWRATSLGTANAGSLAIHPSSGLVFQRKQSADGALVVTGAVKTTSSDIWVEGDPLTTVLSILSTSFPVDQLTLSASNLYTGDPATGLKGGTNSGAADNLLIYNASTGVYDTIWYKNGGIGGTGWRASSLGTADAGGYVIPGAAAVLVQRKNGNSFIWNAPAVTVAP